MSEPKGIIEYRLHKDNSWVGQFYNTVEEKVQHIEELEANGYKIDRIVDYEEEEHKQFVNNYYEWLLS
jgi:hypothetical protein